MQTIKFYQVDAFSNGLFTGNPGGVCLLKDKWLTDNQMQLIAKENNLAETGFVLHLADNWHIRWFTPAVEVDLCGHVTLAAAHVLFNHEGYEYENIDFQSKSGVLSVNRNMELLQLNFPTDTLSKIDTYLFAQCFNYQSIEAYKGRTDYMLVFENEEQISRLIPNLSAIAKHSVRGIIVTAPGNEVDFVARFFAPQSGINEDSVTGSAYTSLTPYWSKRLEKQSLTAIQLSERKGWIQCHDFGQRTQISGKAVTYLIGELVI